MGNASASDLDQQIAWAWGELRSLLAKIPAPDPLIFAQIWRFLGEQKQKDPLYLKEVLVPYCEAALRGRLGSFHIYEQGLFDPKDPRYLLVRSLWIKKKGVLDLSLMQESPYLRNVDILNARGVYPNYLRDEGLAQTLKIFPKVTRLNVESNRISTEGIKHLVSSGALRKITHLYLDDNPIKHEGAFILANCPDVANLQDLSMPLKYKGREAMLNSKYLPLNIRLKIRSM